MADLFAYLFTHSFNKHFSEVGERERNPQLLSNNHYVHKLFHSALTTYLHDAEGFITTILQIKKGRLLGLKHRLGKSRARCRSGPGDPSWARPQLPTRVLAGLRSSQAGKMSVWFLVSQRGVPRAEEAQRRKGHSFFLALPNFQETRK